MTWAAHFAVWMAVCPPDAVRVEFKWLERDHVPGVTQKEGIQTTCGDERSHPHLKAVLTNADVASASSRNLGSVMGVQGDHFLVSFHLKDKAYVTLAAACGEAAARELAVFVDGKYWGTAVFRPARIERFVPQAGFIPSKATADRIVAAFK